MFSKKLRYTQLKSVSDAQFLNIESSVQFFDKPWTDRDVYMIIIQDFIVLLKEDERYAWFQQDGATAHIEEKTMDVLTKFFEDRTIYKGRCLPRSPDLRP